ncbi:hypothetical protein [Crocosphaera sp. Alani8]|uniref:hypothetical protein n=1 Tax=Crocosphaera sp. Alani8 TaxID=3038952 RepID=UPI00313C7F39
MKLSTLIINGIITFTFLNGSVLILDKLESASLPNPFTSNIAEMSEVDNDV